MLPPARVDLMLAGHTHGGYVRLPLIDTITSPSCLGNRFLAGLVQGTHTQVYVNRGLGGAAGRLNARPEITVLRLVGRK